MKWLNNLKIKNKLIFSFTVLIVLTGIIGSIGIINMNSINGRIQNLYEQNYLPSQQLAKVQTNLLKIRSDYLLLLYEKNMTKYQQRVDEINKLTEEDSKIIAEYEKSIQTDEERGLYNTLQSDLSAYREIRNQDLYMIKTGNFAGAAAKISEQTKARDQVDNDLSQLIQLNETYSQKTVDQSDSQFKGQSIAMIIFLMIGILFAIGIGIPIANMIDKPLKQLVKAANEMAAGNLDVSIDVDTRDEVGILAKAFGKMSQQMNEVMSNIYSAAEQVTSGAKQVSETSMSLSQGTTEQASAIEQLSASIEQISSQTSLNDKNANHANDLAEATKEHAINGNNKMHQMLQSMDGIDEASNNISKVIKVIDEIAFQTNILALNAAVEAARAGQHGKGFAVVAEEVRNLAARSADAAKETTDMIEGTIKQVHDGTQIAHETAEALNQIVEDVGTVATLVKEIAMACDEQATGIEQINQGINQVSIVVQSNTATSEEAAAASEQLAGQAEIMKEQVSKFKLAETSYRAETYRGMESLSPEVSKMLDSMSNNKKNKKSEAGLLKQNKIALSDAEFGKY